MEQLILWFKEERGRKTSLANHLNIAPAAVSQWDSVPADRVLLVENFTGISRYNLRSDVFGDGS